MINLNMLQYAIFDTSVLIDLNNKDLNLDALGLGNSKCAITESALLEFIGFISKPMPDFTKERAQKIIETVDNKMSFLSEKGFVVIPKLHDLVKAEIKEGKLISRLCNPLLEKLKAQLKTNKIGDLNQLFRGYEQQRNALSYGKKQLEKNDFSKLKETINNFPAKLNEDIYSGNSINIPIPEINDLIKQEIMGDELFKCSTPSNQAKERAETLIKSSKKSLGIIIISANEITLIDADNSSYTKPYSGNLKDNFPYIFRLLLWKEVHFFNTRSKKGNVSNLAGQLEPNYAIDIEIILNSIDHNSLFITSDPNQHEYAKLIFNEDLETEKKTLKKQNFLLSLKNLS